jgi:acetamidase/formamidase
VQLAGAMFSVGDPHYAQGNGEVALTALEAPLRATIELTVVKPGSSSFGRALFGHAFAETAEAWIAIGLHTDLNEAMRMATRRALDIVCTHSDLDRATAYAYLSAAVDFEVSQVVDGISRRLGQCCRRWRLFDLVFCAYRYRAASIDRQRHQHRVRLAGLPRKYCRIPT